MLKSNILDALNDQMNAELFSSYLYYSMSVYFESQNLRGFANWMRVQAIEELTHVDKFFRFILDRGGKVEMKSLETPKNQWELVKDVWEHALHHEQEVTAQIDNIVDLAYQGKDFATKGFLDWFVAEQVEEESSVSEILEDIKRAEGSSQALFMLDREAGQRTLPPQGGNQA